MDVFLEHGFERIAHLTGLASRHRNTSRSSFLSVTKTSRRLLRNSSRMVLRREHLFALTNRFGVLPLETVRALTARPQEQQESGVQQ
jgi:hypothetical protein